jgi:hypothetical protein
MLKSDALYTNSVHDLKLLNFAAQSASGGTFCVA